jgi:hypothetical protein
MIGWIGRVLKDKVAAVGNADDAPLLPERKRKEGKRKRDREGRKRRKPV